MDILRPIITELTRQRIGVPRSVAEELDSLLKNTELKVSTNPCGYGSAALLKSVEYLSKVPCTYHRIIERCGSGTVHCLYRKMTPKIVKIIIITYRYLPVLLCLIRKRI